MPNVCRLSDMCTGHGGYRSRPCITASRNVFTNNLGTHRVGDIWTFHRRKRAHKGILISGSSTVFVNNRSIGRIGDVINCGSFVATGSPNVFAGD